MSVAGSGLASTTEYIKKYSSTPVEATSTPVELVSEVNPLASNCYLYAQSLAPWLPRTAGMKSNSIYPVVGGIIVLYYGETKHYVYVKTVLAGGVTVLHSNFGKPGFYEDTFTWQYLEEHRAFYVRN